MHQQNSFLGDTNQGWKESVKKLPDLVVEIELLIRSQELEKVKKKKKVKKEDEMTASTFWEPKLVGSTAEVCRKFRSFEENMAV